MNRFNNKKKDKYIGPTSNLCSRSAELTCTRVVNTNFSKISPV